MELLLGPNSLQWSFQKLRQIGLDIKIGLTSSVDLWGLWALKLVLCYLQAMFMNFFLRIQACGSCIMQYSPMKLMATQTLVLLCTIKRGTYFVVHSVDFAASAVCYTCWTGYKTGTTWCNYVWASILRPHMVFTI